MERIFFSTVLFLVLGSTTHAQIKVVGDDYNSTLSGTNNTYSFDVDFEKYFSHTDAKDYYGWIDKYMTTDFNIMGDTIWIPYTLKLTDNGLYYGDGERYPDFGIPPLHWIIQDEGFAVVVDENGNEHWELYPPAGYYEVSGYVFCSDNASMLINKFLPDVSHINIKDNCSIKELKDDILKDEVRINGYLYYVKLSSIDSINGYHYDYYVMPRANKLKFFNISYYNALQNHFLGKRVCFRNEARTGDIGRRYGKIEKGMLYLDVVKKNEKSESNNLKIKGKIILDVLTDENVKLKDSIFIVKDVVVKILERRTGSRRNGKDVAVCCVLEGDSTGRFAIEMGKIQFNYKFYGFDGDTYIQYDSLYCDYPYVIWREWWKNQNTGEYWSEANNAIICVDDLQQLLSDVSDSLLTQKNKDLAKRKNEENERKKWELDYQRKKEAEAVAFKQKVNDKYGTSMAILILNHQISIGMTEDMVKDAWGRPMNTYRTTTKYGQSEVWCYNYKTRIYFNNGKVVQIDD